MVHSDTLRRMWSTTFRGAIECRNMPITEITLNKTIRYNVKLLIYYFQHSIFEHTCVFANLTNMTYILHFLYYHVHSGFTLFGLLLRGLLPWQTSKVLVYFQNKQSVSTGHSVWGINHIKMTCTYFRHSIVLCCSLIVTFSTFLIHDCRRFNIY